MKESRRRVLALAIYLLFLSVALLASPPYTSPLTTEIECVESLNYTSPRLCAYCWNKPDNIHPTHPLEITLPSVSYLILTKGCANYTCKEALQLFSQVGTLQNMPEITQFLEASGSTAHETRRNEMQFPPDFFSWKALVNADHSIILPNAQDFYYNTSRRVHYYGIIKFLVWILTIGICLLTAYLTTSINSKQTKSILAWIILISLTIGDTFLKGIFTKSLLLYLSILSQPATTRDKLFATVATSFVTLASIGEALLGLRYPVSDLLLMAAAGLLAKRVVERSKWNQFSASRVGVLLAFAVSCYMASVDDNHFWNQLMIVSVGADLSMLQVSEENVVEFEAMEGGPYVPRPIDDGMVEVEDTSVI